MTVEKEVKRVKLFTTAKEKENKSQVKEKKPVGNTLSLTSTSICKDDGSSVRASWTPFSYLLISPLPFSAAK